MRRAIGSVVILSLISYACFAKDGDVPRTAFGLYGERTKVCFSSATNSAGYECDGETASTVLVVPLANKREALVNIAIVNFAADNCDLRDAIGSWQDNHLVVSRIEPSQCQFHMYFSSKGLLIREDSKSPCSQFICGGSKTLDYVKLPKKGGL